MPSEGTAEHQQEMQSDVTAVASQKHFLGSRGAISKPDALRRLCLRAGHPKAVVCLLQRFGPDNDPDPGRRARR